MRTLTLRSLQLPILLLSVVFLQACESTSIGPADPSPTSTSEVAPSPTSTHGTPPTSEFSGAGSIELAEEALGILEAEAYVSDEVDWPALRETVLSLAEEADSVEDTYAALAAGVQAVADVDRHSFFIPASSTGALDGLATNSPPVVERRGQVGYVALYDFVGVDPEDIVDYATQLRTQIMGIEREEEVCGWVVDLWGHGGGNMMPGLGGIAPLVGEGVFLRVIGRDEVIEWSMDDSAISLDGGPLLTFDQPIEFDASPIGVVVGPPTASSGEAIALAFRGRSDTRLFGHFTAGFATNNHLFELSDGSYISLMTGLLADRTGDAPGIARPIRPDEIVPNLPEQSPAVEAAITWVETHCDEE